MDRIGGSGYDSISGSLDHLDAKGHRIRAVSRFSSTHTTRLDKAEEHRRCPSVADAPVVLPLSARYGADVAGRESLEQLLQSLPG